MSTTTRHRWELESSSTSMYDICEKCGLRRIRGSDSGPNTYRSRDGRRWIRYAPPCPPPSKEEEARQSVDELAERAWKESGGHALEAIKLLRDWRPNIGLREATEIMSRGRFKVEEVDDPGMTDIIKKGSGGNILCALESKEEVT